MAEVNCTRFLIRDARVFDGEKLLPIASVYVENGSIAAFGPDIAPPDNCEIIDGAGRTLLPSLTDAHTPTLQAAAGPEWQEKYFPLSRFQGLDGHELLGIMFAAGPTPGKFRLQIDEVRFL